MPGFLQVLLATYGGTVPFSNVVHSYTTTGAFTETVPVGAKQVIIETWGAGSGGGTGTFSICNPQFGEGGGSGGYERKTLTLVPLAWSKTLNVNVGVGGAAVQTSGSFVGGAGTSSNVVSGTLTVTSIISNGAGPGAGATVGSGGDINTAGNNPPGTAIVGLNSNSFGAGGAAGGDIGGSAGPGANGAVYFYYS